MPIQTPETLSAYPFDRRYLTQTNNEARYLINGKGIVRRDGGELLFYPVEDDEVEFFHFGGVILNEFLTEVTLMDEGERAQLKLLADLDKRFFEQYGLHAVAGYYSVDDERIPYLKDIVLYEPKSEAYIQVDLMETEYFTPATVEVFGSLAACPLSEPHMVSIAEDGAVGRDN